jgi:hypothetical protein
MLPAREVNARHTASTVWGPMFKVPPPRYALLRSQARTDRYPVGGPLNRLAYRLTTSIDDMIVLPSGVARI